VFAVHRYTEVANSQCIDGGADYRFQVGGNAIEIWRLFMKDRLDRLEQILGGKIEPAGERRIPGTVSVDGTEFCYFSDDGKNKFDKQFKNLTNYTNPPHAKSGGATECGCKIYLPDGLLFHAISYHGDVAGWRKDIEAGARGLNLMLATIVADNFVVAGGRMVALTDCRIEF
jgi:hypothetical protein